MVYSAKRHVSGRTHEGGRYGWDKHRALPPCRAENPKGQEQDLAVPERGCGQREALSRMIRLPRL